VLLVTCFNVLECQKITNDTSTLNDKNNQDTSNCTIKPVLEKTTISLRKMINDNNRLIKLDIDIKWNVSLQDSPLPSSLDWFLTTSNSGKRLLLLPENFTEKSLGTLSYGIAKVHLLLDQEPNNCLANVTANVADLLLKRDLLTLVSHLNTGGGDDDGKTFRICNGTSESGGFCCELTPTGNNIKCETLKNESWRKIFRIVFRVLAFIAFTQSISWIPYDMYEKNTCHTFKLKHLTFDMNFLIANSKYTDKDSNTWKTVPVNNYLMHSNCVLRMFNDFQEKLRHIRRSDFGVTNDEIFRIRIQIKSLTGSVNEHLLHSEVFPLFSIFQFLYTVLKDKFMLCKSKCCEKYFSMNEISVLFLINVFFLPGILYVLYPYFQNNEFVTIFLRFILLVTLMILESMLLLLLWKLFVVLSNYTGDFDLTEMIKHSLRVTFEEENTIDGQTIPFCIRGIKKLSNIFPLFHFLILVITNISKNSKCSITFFCNFLLISASTLISFSVVCYLFVVAIELYVECVFCTILGLFLNYDDVFYFVVLLLIFVKFVNDSFNDVRHKMDSFTRKVFKSIRELSNELRGNKTNESFFLQGDVDHTTCRFALSDDNETVCLLLKGIAVFDGFKSQENIKVRRIHKTFFDKVSALPGHLTPGSIESLLLISCKEIISVIFLFIIILILLSYFGRDNDLSDSVKTLITFITGAVSTILARLWFEKESFSGDANDMYLKELLRKYLTSYEERLTINEIDYDINCSRNNEDENDVDIVVENFSNDQEAWYFKPLVPSFKKTNYIKRMCLRPYECEHNAQRHDGYDSL
jgi:hypothetical protein